MDGLGLERTQVEQASSDRDRNDEERSHLAKARYMALDRYPVTTKEIHPLSKRKQYVSQRHKERLKEFKKWRKREDVQEIMTNMRLIYPSKHLQVYDYLKN